jgi:hypothetical protein
VLGSRPAPIAWELVHPDDPDLQPISHRLLRAVSQAIQWREQLNAARARASLDPPQNVSATGKDAA